MDNARCISHAFFGRMTATRTGSVCISLACVYLVNVSSRYRGASGRIILVDPNPTWQSLDLKSVASPGSDYHPAVRSRTRNLTGTPTLDWTKPDFSKLRCKTWYRLLNKCEEGFHPVQKNFSMR